MTTIVIRDDVMIGDRQTSYHKNNVCKVFQLEDGSAVGFSGDAGKAMETLAWLRGEVPKPALEGKTVWYLRLYPDRRKELCVDLGYPEPIGLDFYAIGAGSDYAMGAMDQGASAAEALRTAMRYCQNTGCGADIVRVVPVDG